MPQSKPHLARIETDDFYTITDLVDLKKLQEIQDTFAEANGVAATLTDVAGVPVTKPSNYSEVCKLVRATEIGVGKCVFSGKQLGEKALSQQKAVHMQCCSIGFTDAAVPIIVDGKHIANWLIGQYHVGNVDDARIKDFALEIGADQEEMLQKFRDMPKIGMQEFEKKVAFLEVMARELSMIGYQKLVEQRQHEELSHAKEQLEKSQLTLEKQVEERTAALQQANHDLAAKIAHAKKLQKRQTLLATAIESATESFVITSLDGEILYINPAFEKLTGYSLQEAVGKTPGILKSGFHDEEFYKQLWQTILTGEPWTGHFTNKKKDGTLYHEEATISAVKDVHGEIANFVAVKKDITRELNLEKQLQQSQKLESIGVLAAGIAHEINTPVQYIMSNTNFFKDVLSDFGEMQASYENLAAAVGQTGTFTEQLDSIARTAESIGIEELKQEAGDAIDQTLEGLNRISDIVSAMKDFAAPGAESKRRIDLNDLIKSTVNISRGQWQEQAELILDLEDQLPPVSLLDDRFKLVLLDMILNANDAMKEKHKSLPLQKGRITISTRSNGNQVEIRLADTGAGIPASVIDKIFDPFFTTKEVGQGSGQGLSTAHSLIVESHQGTIGVTSVEGEGTEFTIGLPFE